MIAALVERGIYRIRAVVRDINKAKTLFGEENMDKIQVCDFRYYAYIHIHSAIVN